jgi:hypothetical protein
MIEIKLKVGDDIPEAVGKAYRIALNLKEEVQIPVNEGTIIVLFKPKEE